MISRTDLFRPIGLFAPTMRDSSRTRDHILRQAAGLFNRRGYAGVSISDIMAATGLKKGGIYNHFENKEQLAREVFDYSLRRVRRRFIGALLGKRTATDRLLAIVGVMQHYVEDPPVPGGCPVFNTAADSNDAYPTLLTRARQGMDELQDYIRHTVREGIADGELRADADPDAAASIIVALLEGALLLSRLYDDAHPMDHAVTHLTAYVEGMRHQP